MKNYQEKVNKYKKSKQSDPDLNIHIRYHSREKEKKFIIEFRAIGRCILPRFKEWHIWKKYAGLSDAIKALNILKVKNKYWEYRVVK